MLSIEQLKTFLPFLGDVDFLHPKVPPVKEGWRFPLMPGYSMEDLPEQIKIPATVPGTAIPTAPAKPSKFTITADQLMRIIPLGVVKAKELAEAFNKALARYGMDNKYVFPDYLAQAAHESDKFKAKVENLNYRAEVLVKIFKKYFPTIAATAGYVGHPEKIANKVYADRMGNRNEASGDGFKNRGGGYFQLTGYIVWSMYLSYIKQFEPDMTMDKLQDLVRGNEHYAIDSSLWYFAVYASLKDEAQKDQFLKITKAVNGGYNGVDDRKDIFNAGLKVYA